MSGRKWDDFGRGLGGFGCVSLRVAHVHALDDVGALRASAPKITNHLSVLLRYRFSSDALDDIDDRTLLK